MKKSKTLHVNKKGFSMIAESDKILFWMLVVGVIAACLIVIATWTSVMKKMYLNDNLASTAYEARLIYSDKCFAYKDPDTGRVYAGTIDPAKFTQNNLFSCLPLNGMSTYAISAKLQTGNAEPFVVKSANWEMKTDEIVVHTYIVQVQGYGPGLITFYHKSGE